MECKTCSGLRFVSVKRQQTITKNIHYTKDGYPAWPRIGAYVVKETFPTGRTVTHLEPCEDCDATGLAVDPARNPDCYWCHGRGERNAWDMDEYTVEQCDCEAPVPALEVA